MTKIQNKAYLKILHNLSFPKSLKSLNLDKPIKSYAGFGARDLAVKGQGPKLKETGPIREETRDLNEKLSKSLRLN